MTDLAILERELRDEIAYLADLEGADAEGRVVDHARWSERYCEISDRVHELERRIETLRTAAGATQTRT